ncbi:MAG: class I SAM-dependent methyltransferase [Micropruina sp.]|nr:class I SAM-dependent methyltransferase [Micropruina sp.]
MSAPVSSFPSPALGWLTDLDLSPAGQLSTLAKRSSVLVVGQHSAAPATTLHQHRVRLTVIDSTREGVGRMLKHTPSAIPVTAAASSLPFVPCSFDTVLIAQGLHLLDPEPALAEFARVLRPGAHVSICYTTRDDSVPCVRRLIALLREVDSSAMAGAYGFGVCGRARVQSLLPARGAALVPAVGSGRRAPVGRDGGPHPAGQAPGSRRQRTPARGRPRPLPGVGSLTRTLAAALPGALLARLGRSQ